ncbi:unnamed protein product [Spodoptera exigua]|nr:unnamed protein product [Spodoptera exigua]
MIRPKRNAISNIEILHKVDTRTYGYCIRKYKGKLNIYVCNYKMHLMSTYVFDHQSIFIIYILNSHCIF